METGTKKKVRVRRSEKLTPEERKAFAKKVDSFEFKLDAAEYFGLTTVTLQNIELRGSAKPATVALIREKIKE